MENVESDPKTDRPKVCSEGDGGPAYWALAGSLLLLTEPFCHQEEVCICTTTVFVDPYEEADAQVRKGLAGHAVGWTHPGGSGSALCSLLAPTLGLWIRQLCYPQIAQERKKTQQQVDPEAKVKSQPPPGNQGPQTYRQGVGKYINPAAT